MWCCPCGAPARVAKFFVIGEAMKTPQKAKAANDAYEVCCVVASFGDVAKRIVRKKGAKEHSVS